MSKIEDKFQELDRRGEKALIPYLMAGDPDPERSLSYARGLIRGGADILELGVPFSDPVADGPTIQGAKKRALEAGCNLSSVFGIVEELRAGSRIPIVLMTYYNPLFRLGEKAFFQRCGECGVDGVIVADLPVNEADSCLREARKYSVDTIFLATPNTDEQRLGEITDVCSGFLYLVARLGTTGAKSELASYTKSTIAKIAPNVPGDLPLAVGFGLSSRSQIEEVVNAGADGAIVGSAIVGKISEGLNVERIMKFVRELKKGTEVTKEPT